MLSIYLSRAASNLTNIFVVCFLQVQVFLGISTWLFAFPNLCLIWVITVVSILIKNSKALKCSFKQRESLNLLCASHHRTITPLPSPPQCQKNSSLRPPLPSEQIRLRRCLEAAQTWRFDWSVAELL